MKHFFQIIYPSLSVYNNGQVEELHHAGVDMFRFIAIFSVIWIHTLPLELGNVDNNFTLKFLHMICQQFARFAVRFFFCISGYYFGKKWLLQNRFIYSATLQNTFRLLIIYLFWFGVYLLIPSEVDKLNDLGFVNLFSEKMEKIFQSGGMLFLKGPPSGYHLWYIPSLICAMLIILSFLPFKGIGLLPFAFLLYLIALSAMVYSDTWVGIHLDFYLRFGPFMSTLFYAIGYKMATQWSQIIAKISLIQAIAIALIGFCLHMAECLGLYFYYGVSPTAHEFYLGTVPFATGMAMVALKLMIRSNLFSYIGWYTLGVYVSHLLIVNALFPFIKSCSSLVISLAFPFIVYFLSFFLSWVISKNKYLKALVF